MHTVALTSKGTVYTWGCNDEGALGREGPENTPEKVEIEIAVTDISAGDSHTIAYNTNDNVIYYWGCYRVSINRKYHKSALLENIQFFNLDHLINLIKKII